MTKFTESELQRLQAIGEVGDYLAFAAAQFPSGTVNCAKGEEIRYRFLNSRLRIW